MKSLHNEGTSAIVRRSEALELLWALATRLGQGMQQGLAERGLTLARAGLIWELQARGPCTQRALSLALRVTPRNVTGLVDGLEADGLVERTAHPSDRRATLVAFTEKGRALASRIEREQDEFAQYLFADAAPAELDALIAALNRVLGRIEPIFPAAP